LHLKIILIVNIYCKKVSFACFLSLKQFVYFACKKSRRHEGLMHRKEVPGMKKILRSCSVDRLFVEDMQMLSITATRLFRSLPHFIPSCSLSKFCNPLSLIKTPFLGGSILIPLQATFASRCFSNLSFLGG